MKIAMAQINPTVGDLERNVNRIIHYMSAAKRKKVELVTFLELTITGYPPQDLIYEDSFIHKNKASLKKIPPNKK